MNADLDAIIDRAKAGPRILLFDLERLPGAVDLDVWEPGDFRRVNWVHPDRWHTKPSLLCGSWLWYGDKRPGFAAAWDSDDPAHVATVFRDLLHQADVCVTFNGRKADLKWLRQDWARHGITPPRPFRDIDLYVVARSAFALESRSLAYLCDFLGLPGKDGRYDAAEAKAAAAGDTKAQRRLARYNRQDSAAMVPVLDRLRPYLRGVNLGLPFLDEAKRCPACGSDDVRRDGWVSTGVTSFAAYVCACGAWSRSGHRKHHVELRPA